MWCRRSRELGANLGQHQPIARQVAEFRASQLLHGVDQPRQPQILAVSRSPDFPLACLNLLAHYPSLGLSLRRSPKREPQTLSLPIRSSQTRSRTMPQRKSEQCDLVHKRPGRIAVNRLNGPESIPTVIRSESRPRHRLRPDRDRRRSRLDRADLSRPDLIQRRGSGSEKAPSLG